MDELADVCDTLKVFQSADWRAQLYRDLKSSSLVSVDGLVSIQVTGVCMIRALI